MNFILNKHLSASLNWLFPPICLFCQTRLNTKQDKQYCCDACYCALPFKRYSCRQCGQSIAADLSYCGYCLTKPPIYQRCFTPFYYQHPISDLIHRFKYANQPELVSALGDLFADEIQANELDMPDLLIPVPLHSSKLVERGFNQALLLTKQLSKRLDIPLDNNIVIKIKATESQVGQKSRQRKANLKGSFKLKEMPKINSIAIIDDVITTGTTAHEIAKLLRKNGVKDIQVWCLAQTG